LKWVSLYVCPVMTIKGVFGKNLRYYRKLKRLSQEELSEKVDITAKHLSAIETGSSFVSAELLESLMRTLEVSASALFYSPEEKAAGGDAGGREEAPFREAAGEKPSGDGVFTLVDTVVTEELAKTGLAIRNRIRRAGNG